jgi:hypothetical protein
LQEPIFVEILLYFIISNNEKKFQSEANWEGILFLMSK